MPAAAATYPPGFSEEVLVSGLTRPMQVAWAPDGRMFVIQKDGLLLVVAPGASSAARVEDFSRLVYGQRDRGLLGLAVDPGFQTNGFVYLLYTYDVEPGGVPEVADAPMVSQLRRLRLDPLTNRVLDQEVILGRDTTEPCPAPANTVDCLPSEGYTHTIGTVRADADGTLWVSNGDGMSPGAMPPPLRTYSDTSLAGKLLHIDRDGRGLPDHPFCPANTNLSHVCTKLHAKGFRNPFRFTLRPGGGVVLGDVGWADREELNLIGAEGGGNYGWPCYEGTILTPRYRDQPGCTAGELPPATVSPDLDYPHVAGNAVLGGPTYLGDSYPAGYRGSIFFGDFAAGFIRRLVPDGAGGYTSQEFAQGWSGVAIETAPNGDLVTVSAGQFQSGQGTITRIVYTPPAPPAAPPPSAPPVARPTAVDKRGPRLRLKSVLPRRGRLSGTATDSSGVRKVLVALRRKQRGGGCSWWLRGQRQMSSGRRSCDRPRWMTASLKRVTGGVRWSVLLRRKLPPGGFRVLVRATDRRGNVARLAPSPATLVRVKKDQVRKR